MKTILWQVEYTTCPAVMRYCKKCGAKTDFVSSELFRINAQQKNLDIWLIYKCAQCGSTWNLTIFSRVSPRSLPADMLEEFHGNDQSLARRYALDAALIRQNGGIPGLPGYKVTGRNVNGGETARVRIAPPCPSDLKVSAVIRQKLGLSRREWEGRLETGQIRSVSGLDLQKSRLQGEILVEISG